MSIFDIMMKDIETAITQRITHSHVNWSDVVRGVRRPVENNTTIIRNDDIYNHFVIWRVWRGW